MAYFYLFMAMMFSGLLTVGSRLYNNKNRDRASVSGLYSLLAAAAAALLWLILWCTDFSFDVRVLPYSAMFGAVYCSFTAGMLGGVKTGSTSLTALIKQVALVSVSIWGFFFWDTKFTVLTWVGLGLLLISMCLCLLVKEQKSGNHNMGKWLFYCLLILIGNAGCAITLRYQQMAFDYRHKNMFMFFAHCFAMVFCWILFRKEDKTNWKSACKSSWPFAALSGSSGAITNMFILLLVKINMSPAVLYPGVAVGGLILTTVFAIFFFRERLRLQQWLGLAFGAVALVLLNL